MAGNARTWTSVKHLPCVAMEPAQISMEASSASVPVGMLQDQMVG